MQITNPSSNFAIATKPTSNTTPTKTPNGRSTTTITPYILNGNGDNISRPSEVPEKPKRMDIANLKEEITKKLGDNAEMYWATMKKFLTGKSKRGSMENEIYPCLKAGKCIDLHNRFLIGVLYNAQHPDPPPVLPFPEDSDNSKKHGREEEEGKNKDDSQTETKRRRIKKLVMSLGREERERIKQIPKEPSRSPSASNFLDQPLAKPSQMQHPTFTLPSLQSHQSKQCVDIKALPNYSTLKQRLADIARHRSLSSGVSDDCVNLMGYALESHLKNIVGNCLQKTRTGGSLGISTFSNRGTSTSMRKNTITPKDLAFSFEMAPHILVEPSRARERLTTMTRRDEDEDSDEVVVDGDFERTDARRS